MNTDITIDILRKAAEDIRQEGVWCTTTWFKVDGEPHEAHELFDGTITIDEALAGQRCAEGAIALATKQLGWGQAQYKLAVAAVQDQLLIEEGEVTTLNYWNDAINLMPTGTMFKRDGHQVADLFVRTADRMQGLA